MVLPYLLVVPVIITRKWKWTRMGERSPSESTWGGLVDEPERNGRPFGHTKPGIHVVAQFGIVAWICPIGFDAACLQQAVTDIAQLVAAEGIAFHPVQCARDQTQFLVDLFAFDLAAEGFHFAG